MSKGTLLWLWNPNDARDRFFLVLIGTLILGEICVMGGVLGGFLGGCAIGMSSRWLYSWVTAPDRVDSSPAPSSNPQP